MRVDDYFYIKLTLTTFIFICHIFIGTIALLAKLFQLALFYDILIAGESNQMIFIAKVYTYIEHIIGSHLVDFGHCQSNFYVFIFVHCISETFKISIFFNCRQSEIKWVVDRVFLANVFIAVTYYKLFLLPQILIK